jgi:DNA segregation ATPase FtsK/SpoIIIE-like protein
MTPLPDTSLSAPVALIRAALATSSSDQISVVPGYDESGDPIIHDLAAMPHLLVAGSDRASLQQMLHTLLASVLLKETPVTCRLVLIDPTGLEFGVYADIPHLLSPIANAPAEGMQLLRWASTELDARYVQLAAVGVRNIASYAKKRASMPWLPAMPHVVCAVSQYEDLRMLDEGEFDPLALGRKSPRRHPIADPRKPRVTHSAFHRLPIRSAGISGGGS